jgi:AhpC/TSA family/Thiol:disulfide interchange protein DsbD, N-terminal
LAAISYDSAAILKNFAGRKHITFPLLSDPSSKIIRAFGILNETIDRNTPFYGVPFPGSYLVDARGVVRAKFFEDSYAERDTLSAILARQFGLRPSLAHTTTAAKHLQFAASSTAALVHPGQHILLALDLELGPRMHIYAPGVEGYIPFDWQMPASPAITAGPPIYPPSVMLHLDAIDETVPVYEGSVHIEREVVIEPEKQVRLILKPGGEMTVQGTFRYQACDDRVCYVPETVPVTWTLHFEPVDTERVPPELQHKAPVIK